jgi:hypothetical protein
MFNPLGLLTVDGKSESALISYYQIKQKTASTENLRFSVEAVF